MKHTKRLPKSYAGIWMSDSLKDNTAFILEGRGWAAEGNKLKELTGGRSKNWPNIISSGMFTPITCSFSWYRHIFKTWRQRFSVKDSPKNCLERLIFSLRVTPCMFSAQCVSILRGLSLMAHSAKTPFQLSTIPTTVPKTHSPHLPRACQRQDFFIWFPALSPFRGN